MQEVTKANVLDGLVEAIADAVARKIISGQEKREVRLLSVDEAARYIGRTPVAVRHMIAKKQLTCVRRDGRVQLDRADLDTWVELGKSGK